jgi:hypothetical protein
LRLRSEFPHLPTPIEENVTIEFITKLISTLRDELQRIYNAINGGLSLGDGANLENIYGTWANVTFSGTPGTELTVNHNNGRVPAGYLILYTDRAGTIYKGATTWTDKLIYLKSDTASLQARILIV